MDTRTWDSLVHLPCFSFLHGMYTMWIATYLLAY